MLDTTEESAAKHTRFADWEKVLSQHLILVLADDSRRMGVGTDLAAIMRDAAVAAAVAQGYKFASIDAESVYGYQHSRFRH